MQKGLSNKVIITDGEKFNKVVDTSVVKYVKLPEGTLEKERFDEIKPGSTIEVNNKKYYIFNCDLHDYVMYGLKRETQIVYPKEAGYILTRMDIFYGKKIGEAGTGSGALTSFFSRAVGPEGKVYTYEYREKFAKLAAKNLARCMEFDNVIIHNKLLEEGIEESELDAFFLDHRSPWEVMGLVRDSLKNGGNLGLIVPTTNQVSQVLNSLEEHNFYVAEVTELMKREFKKNPERLRPDDIMVGHTGYLIFGKKLV